MSLYERPQLARVTCLALPDYEYAPSELGQGRAVAAVTSAIRFKLLAPELCARLGCAREAAAGMPVPEAPVHKDDGAVLGQNDVRRARKILSMQAEPVAKFV
jgi:hypothetical protein